MDRMAFIPGAHEREAIESANGHIFFNRATALSFAKEFLAEHPLLYQIALAAMSEGDRVDIRFGLRNVNAPEEIVASGELLGHTKATFTAFGAGKMEEKLLWKVGRGTDGLRRVDGRRAFNAFRKKMAEEKALPVPEPIPENDEVTHSNTAAIAPGRIPAPMPESHQISRALSPSHLYEASGVMWYFVDLSMRAPTSGGEQFVTKLQLSRPMNAFDTVILAALLTLIRGAPPLVFGVFLGEHAKGKLPESYKQADYLFAPGVVEDENEMIIVG